MHRTRQTPRAGVVLSAALLEDAVIARAVTGPTEEIDPAALADA